MTKRRWDDETDDGIVLECQFATADWTTADNGPDEDSWAIGLQWDNQRQT